MAAQLALNHNCDGSDMKLHGYFRSSAAYRCRIALNLKGLEVEHVPVHLRLGEQRNESFLNLNPQGLVPALEVNGHILPQSLSIIEYLDEAFPSPPLLPSDAVARAQVRALAQSIACDIHPLQNLRVLKYLRGTLSQPDDTVQAWCRHWIFEGLAAFEAQLRRLEKVGDYCWGGMPSLADICLVPQAFSAERFGVDIGGLPLIQRVIASAAAHPAFAAAHPARQVDAE